MSKPRIGVLGKVLWEEFPDAGEPPFVDAAKWAMEERAPVRVEQYYTPLDIWFEVSVVPIPTGLAIYVTDIHERRRRDSDVAQLASIVDSTEDAIMSVSTEGVFTSWNPAAERIFGYSVQEAIGSTLGSIMVPAGQPDDAEELFKRVEQGEVLIAKEVRRWRKDGSPVDVSVTLSPIREASGRLTGVSAISRDITRERQAAGELRDAEARYRALVEQVPVIIYDWGVEGDIDHVSENYVSPQIEGILGFKPEEWIADPTLWFSQVHPDDLDDVVAASVRSIEEASPLRIEYRMLAKDGHTVWLRDEALVMERDAEGKATLFQGVQLDITAEKRAEEAVRKAADERAQLIQLLAHELFTPITAIQGAALTLSSLGERLSPTDLSVLAEGVARGARRLQRLVQNLDAAAKLDREDVPISRRSVPIGEILRLALREFQTESEGSGINVSAEEELVGRRTVADLSLAAQALSVVIENALDYSNGEAVDIDLLERDERLLIRVSDRGPGITPEQRDHIFELFAQADSSDTRSHEGLGVGLFLARRVMDVHEGELVYEARPDGGAMFTFHFVPSRTPA
jgi:PAS domain S-box-containing protein